MEKDDPFGFIMRVRRTQGSRLRDKPPLVLPPATPSSSANEHPLYGPIPPHLLGNFICRPPDHPPRPPPPNTTTTSNVDINDEPNNPLCIVSFQVTSPPEDFPPRCGESFQDFPPPGDFLLESSDVDHHHIGQGIDDGEDCAVAVDVADPCKVWLWKLKSVAVSLELSGDVLSFLTKFRASVFFSGEEKNLGYSLELRRKGLSHSDLGEPSSSKIRKCSGTSVGLGSLKYTTRRKLLGANAVNVVARSEYPSMKKDLGLSSNFKDSKMWLSKLKAMARLEGFFKGLVSFFTEFRAEYWDSRGQSPSSKSNAKKKLVSVSGEPPTKKRKHSDKILGLRPSTSKSGTELEETEGGVLIVLSDSEDDEQCGRVLDLGRNTMNEGVPLKDAEVGGSKSDESHTKSNGNLVCNKTAKYLGKSNAVRLSDDMNVCPAEPCEGASSTCAAAKKSTATSGGMECNSVSSKDAFLTMVLYSVQVIKHANPGGDGSDSCPAKLHEWPLSACGTTKKNAASLGEQNAVRLQRMHS